MVVTDSFQNTVIAQETEKGRLRTENDRLRTNNIALSKKLSSLMAVYQMLQENGPSSPGFVADDVCFGRGGQDATDIEHLMQTHAAIHRQIWALEAENSSLQQAIAAQLEFGTVHHATHMLQEKKKSMELEAAKYEAQLSELRRTKEQLRAATEPIGEALEQTGRERKELTQEVKALQRKLDEAKKKTAEAEREVRSPSRRSRCKCCRCCCRCCRCCCRCCRCCCRCCCSLRR